jgi:hypothetical protein
VPAKTTRRHDIPTRDHLSGAGGAGIIGYVPPRPTSPAIVLVVGASVSGMRSPDPLCPNRSGKYFVPPSAELLVFFKWKTAPDPSKRLRGQANPSQS